MRQEEGASRRQGGYSGGCWRSLQYRSAESTRAELLHRSQPQGSHCSLEGNLTPKYYTRGQQSEQLRGQKVKESGGQEKKWWNKLTEEVRSTARGFLLFLGPTELPGERSAPCSTFRVHLIIYLLTYFRLWKATLLFKKFNVKVWSQRKRKCWTFSCCLATACVYLCVFLLSVSACLSEWESGTRLSALGTNVWQHIVSKIQCPAHKLWNKGLIVSLFFTRSRLKDLMMSHEADSFLW